LNAETHGNSFHYASFITELNELRRIYLGDISALPDADRKFLAQLEHVLGEMVCNREADIYSFFV